ncbi:Mrp13 [Kluyveromyces lactis]|nr:Mrp13 [Kluyveromyces lactis]
MFSRVFTRSVSTGVESRAVFDNFLQFVKTPQTLRPYIYRKKNANRLLAMDLKDPETKLPIQPRPSVLRPSASVLNSVILNTSSAEELENMVRDWKNITPRRKEFWSYLTPQHLQNMLLTSTFKFGALGAVLNVLYQIQPLLVKAKQLEAYNVDVWYNTVLMCQLHRNAFHNVEDSGMVERGLRKLSSTVTKREDTTGLTKEIVQALGRQQNVEVKLPNFARNIEINLPSIDVSTASQNQLRTFLTKNTTQYLLSRTALDFGSTEAKLQQFVENYQAVLAQNSVADIYDKYVSQYKQLLTQKSAESETTEEAHADAQAEETK